MKKLLSAAVLLIVLAATAANVNLRPRKVVVPAPEVVRDSVVIQGDSLFLDTLQLSLNTIPRAQHLYTVAKVAVGKWAKLFTVVKLEESGADGKNSYYARKLNNLTGMRFPRSGRQTTALRNGLNNYAEFAHWYDCMIDWKYYIELMEEGFKSKKGREPKDEFEMVDYMFGSYNPYSIWRTHLRWHLNHFKYK